MGVNCLTIHSSLAQILPGSLYKLKHSFHTWGDGDFLLKLTHILSGRKAGTHTHTDTHIGTCTHTHTHKDTQALTGTHRHTHTDTHIGVHTHTHTHIGVHTHTLTQRHTGTQRPLSYGLFNSCLNTAASMILSKLSQITSLACQTLLFGSENEDPYSHLPGPREPGPRRPSACVLGPFTQPQRPPCRASDTRLLWARSPQASQPSRVVFSQTSTRPLQATGQCVTVFLMTLSKVPPGAPYAPSLSYFYPLHLSLN